MHNLISYFTTSFGVIIIAGIEILGFFGAIVGFIIAINNTRKSKKAAEEAFDMARNVQREMRRYDTSNDLGVAVSKIEEIRRLHRKPIANNILEMYSSLRNTIIAIKSNYPNLSDDQKKVLQSSIQVFSDIENEIEPLFRDSDEIVADIKFNKQLIVQASNLQEIAYTLRNRTGENNERG